MTVETECMQRGLCNNPQHGLRKQAGLTVSSLLSGTRAASLLILPAFENQKIDRFHGNGQYGKILTKKEAVKTLV